MKSISKISFTIFTLLILSIFSFLLFQFSLAKVYAAGILGKLAKELMGEAIQTGIDTGAEITEGYDSSVRLFSEPKQASKDTIQVNLINRYKDSCIDRANSTEFNSIQDFQLNNISEMYYRGISLVDSGKCNEALNYFDKVS